MILRSNPKKRLTAVRDELAGQRERLRVLDEQLAHVQGVADDATVDAVVADNAFAQRERSTAEGDLRRLRRERDEVAARIAALVQTQDELLERLLDERQG